jgi:hypothetical protein
MCTRARVCLCVKRIGEKRRKWQPFRLHMLGDYRTARSISEYLWVIVGGKKKEGKKTRKEWWQGECPKFLYIYKYIFSLFFCCCSFPATLLHQYNMTPSHSHLLVFWYVTQTMHELHRLCQCHTDKKCIKKRTRTKLSTDKQCHL